MDSMPVATDTLGFDVACAALESATRDLQRLTDDPTATLAALSKAQRHYDLSRTRWLQFEWQFRAAAVHALEPSPLRVGQLLVVGPDKAIRESLAVLLAVKGYGRPKASGFDAFDFADASGGQLVIVDVPWHSDTAARWFVESFDGSSDKPHIIALVHPEADNFSGKVDRVVAKPLVLHALLEAIGDIDRTVAMLMDRKTTMSAPTAVPLPASSVSLRVA
ncbi:response regulator receiver protein [Paraburkholderia sabiae]|uniref:Response regulator receiver protein n=1 Tax=Paraburkholderia sabiae TaxID=273251 RepID=A0ABU9QRT0_9BURK|nr:response regulator receiver protein [Paraburkholderia sabiae]WJZ79324.1 response regulator receiver protein [Paraburkholderia sabiae]CAD6563047.1 hypothetical protein LMG24235_08289 [Paraburkholderia sabiae]